LSISTISIIARTCWYWQYQLSTSTNSIVDISDSNCRYQQIMSIIDIKYCTLQYINIVQYRQFELSISNCNLSISTIRVADIRNSKCLYRQWVLNDDSAYHIGKVVSALERCKMCRLPWEHKLPRLRVILLYTTGTMFR